MDAVAIPKSSSKHKEMMWKTINNKKPVEAIQQAI